MLELLIVIAIVAILSVSLVIVLNPAETLKKARDAQRISDLSTLKTAIGLYLTNVNPVYLGGAASNTECQATAGTWQAGDKIFYSTPSSSAITDAVLDGAGGALDVQVATPGLVDATGWIPIDFTDIPGGAPISVLPVDPVNDAAYGGSALDAITDEALVYRYGCSVSPVAYEVDATLESTAYTVTDDKRASDGGNNTHLYETGTNLSIFGTGQDF